MKTGRKLLLLLLALAMAFTFFACGGGGEKCTEHKDENSDKICDVCGEKVEDNNNGENETLTLIENGTAKFKFILQTGIPQTIRTELLSGTKQLGKMGMQIEIANDRADTAEEGIVEVLVGVINSRGEQYKFNDKQYGPEGMAIKIIEGKIILAAGSEDAYIDVVERFYEKILGLDDDTTELGTVTMAKSQEYEKFQDNFRVTSFSINGTLANEHIIAVDISEPNLLATAEMIQDNLYKNVGYWCEIVNIKTLEEIPEKAIVLEVNPDVKKEGGFKISVKDSKLLIETAYPLKVETPVKDFLSSNITIKKGDVNLAKTLKITKEQRYIYYSEFGAQGLGYKNNDDFKAICEAHNYANKNGHIVKADPDAVYYIGKTGDSSIVIKTDVIWGNAKFIIDDSEILPTDKEIKTSVFVVSSDYSRKVHGSDSDVVKKIKKAIADSEGSLDFSSLTDFFGFAPGYDAMLFPTDTNHKVYIRYGENENGGQNQSEVIVVDKDGKIDKDTPFLLDYNDVTHVLEYRIDETPITISGGLLVTIANQAPSAYTYYSRNISISRSNVTIKDLEHQIEGEGDSGAPYSGFISPGNLNNLLVENCVFQAHRWYWNADPATGGATSMGTYEIGGSNANKLTYKNCRQSNFYDPDGRPTSTWYDKDGNTGLQNTSHKGDGGGGRSSGIWGVMGSNYCKNITYIDCVLNRFDAHAGLYNASIIGGAIISINLIGGGTALIDGTTVYNSSLITLRGDYGSTWHGDVVIKDVTWVTNYGMPFMMTGTWYPHYFGYPIYLPNVTVDNLTFEGTAPVLYVFNDYGHPSENLDDPNLIVTLPNGSEVKNPNPLFYSEWVKIKGCGNLDIKVSTDGCTFNRIPIIRDEE